MNNRKTIISEKIQETTVQDEEGNILSSTTTKESHMLARNGEPDYIKIYTRMWCEFNQIPERVRPLFLQLAMRMSYCNSCTPEESQLVFTTGPVKQVIKKAIGVTNDKVFYRYLQELVDCNAIRKVGRGCYQINPQYAGRGAWRYNARENQGGIEDLVATFSFRDGTVSTKITWAADSRDYNAQELGLFHDGQQIVARQTTITPNVIPTDNQISIDDILMA